MRRRSAGALCWWVPLAVLLLILGGVWSARLPGSRDGHGPLLTPQGRLPETERPPLRAIPEEPLRTDWIWVATGEAQNPEERQALRAAGQRVFYDVVDGISGDELYSLGLVGTGTYRFVLLSAVREDGQCTYEQIAEVRFSVVDAESSRSLPESGLLMLELAVPEEAEAVRLVSAEAPQVALLYDWWGSIAVLPGLESFYRPLLGELEGLTHVGLDWVASAPECPPPFGPAYVPGRLTVRFGGAERPDMAEFLGKLPPRLEAWEPCHGSAEGDANDAKISSRAWVSIPRGWESVFLDRYLGHPEVLHGEVVESLERSWDE